MSAEVSGTCADEFEPLRELLARNLADGTDAGASVALVRDGELVVDLWGGEARPGQPWEQDTVVQVWSVGKTMAALTALVLADRGELDLDAPVSSYWPEFRREDVLVRHLLAHTSGYAGWTEKLDIAGLLDLERSERMLAEQEPWWEPGTASGYHMISYGHLLDGLARGATRSAQRASTSSGTPRWKSAPSGSATRVRKCSASGTPVAPRTSPSSRWP